MRLAKPNSGNAWVVLVSALLVIGLVVVVLVGHLLARATESGRSPAPPAPPERRPSVRADVQLLFTEFRDSMVTVDGVVVEGEQALPSGAPLTLAVETPTTGPLATVVLTTLDRWALACQVVDLELRALPPGITARLSDGTSTVNLEVATAQLG